MCFRLDARCDRKLVVLLSTFASGRPVTRSSATPIQEEEEEEEKEKEEVYKKISRETVYTCRTRELECFYLLFQGRRGREMPYVKSQHVNAKAAYALLILWFSSPRYKPRISPCYELGHGVERSVLSW